METTTVRMLVELNEDAIREHLPLERWADMLKLGGVDEGDAESGPRAIEPDWEAVYEKIATAWIGAQVYQAYCKTAQDDLRLFERFVLNEGITLVDKPTTGGGKTSKVLPMVPPTRK